MYTTGKTVLQSWERPGLKLKLDSFSSDNLFLFLGKNTDFQRKARKMIYCLLEEK